MHAVILVRFSWILPHYRNTWKLLSEDEQELTWRLVGSDFSLLLLSFSFRFLALFFSFSIAQYGSESWHLSSRHCGYHNHHRHAHRTSELAGPGKHSAYNCKEGELSAPTTRDLSQEQWHPQNRCCQCALLHENCRLAASVLGKDNQGRKQVLLTQLLWYTELWKVSSLILPFEISCIHCSQNLAQRQLDSTQSAWVVPWQSKFKVPCSIFLSVSIFQGTDCLSLRYHVVIVRCILSL